MVRYGGACSYCTAGPVCIHAVLTVTQPIQRMRPSGVVLWPLPLTASDGPVSLCRRNTVTANIGRLPAVHCPGVTQNC